jgi:hypothetical protein
MPASAQIFLPSCCCVRHFGGQNHRCLENRGSAAFGKFEGASFTRIPLQGLHGAFRFAFISYVWRSGDRVAPVKRMRRDFVIPACFLLAVLFMGTLGAFLLYVPAFTVFTVILILSGLGLMFALGLQTGARWRRLSFRFHQTTHQIKRVAGQFPASQHRL